MRLTGPKPEPQCYLDSMYKDKDEDEVAFDSHICKETAKELGVSEKMIYYHLEFLKHWIYHLTQQPFIHSIKLNCLGKFYRNLPVSKHHLGRKRLTEERYPTTKERNDILEQAVNDLEKQLEENQKTHFQVQRKIRRINNVYFTKLWRKKRLEEYQNEKNG